MTDNKHRFSGKQVLAILAALLLSPLAAFHERLCERNLRFACMQRKCVPVLTNQVLRQDGMKEIRKI